MPYRKGLPALAVVFIVGAALAAANLFPSPVDAPGAGNRSSGTTTSPVQGFLRSSGEPVLPSSISLVGQTIGVGTTGNSGTITVHAGSLQVATATTISPQFTVSVPRVGAGEMVWLEVENNGLKYLSLLGTYGNLVSRAGSDQILTVAESDRLRVSPISTALYFFVTRQLGRVPYNDQDYERALRSVVGNDIGLAATMLDSVASGSMALPSGYSTGYALLKDQDNYRAFLAQHPEVSGNSASYLSIAPSIPFNSAELQGDLVFLKEIPLNSAPVREVDALILRKGASGYEEYARPSRRNADFADQLTPSGDLRLTPRGAVYYDIQVVKTVAPNNQNALVWERHTVQQQTYRRQFSGDAYNFISVISDEILSYPDYPALAPQQFTSVEFWMASNLNNPPRRLKALYGSFALPIFCKTSAGSEVQLQPCEYALHQFGPGEAGQAVDLGAKVDADLKPAAAGGSQTFKWRIDSPNSLTLTYSGGSTTYWRIDRGNDAADSWAYVARTQDGADTLATGGQVAVINGNAPAAFSALTPVGTWKYATFEEFQFPYAWNDQVTGAPTTTRFTRYSQGTAMQETVPDDPQFTDYHVSAPSGWRLINDRLYDTRVVATMADGSRTRRFFTCEQAFSQGAVTCKPYRVRYFRPLAQVGNRLYGIEDIYLAVTTSPGAPTSQIRVSRPNFYEKLAD